MLRFYILSAIGACVFLSVGNPVRAATCSGSISAINFGDIELRTGISNQSTGNLVISCTGAIVSSVGVCVRLGAGSGGGGAGNSPRYLAGAGGALLAYQLRPNGFGSSNGIWNDRFLQVPILLGSGSISATLFSQITANSPSVGAGSYTSTFSGFDAVLDYEVTSCLDTGVSVTLPSFPIAGTVVSSCEVSTTAMAFGGIPSPVTVSVDASAIVTVQCSQNAAYSVQLGLGNGAGVTDPAARKMSTLTDVISYGLYSDAARTNPWGNLTTNDVEGTGTGTPQLFNVYGRVHTGQSPTLGAYSDQVVVTIVY